MRLVSLLVFICVAASLTAQNLTGIWRGTRTQNPGGCYPEYSLELQITYAGNSIMGNAYNYYDRDKYTKINFSGRYNPQTKRMVIVESAVLQYNIPAYCIPCIKTYDLSWMQNGIEETLTGEWKGHEMGNANVCPPGKIRLTRQDQSLFPVEVLQNDTLASLQKAMKIQKRQNEVVQDVIVDTSQIKIELYDNAEIDDDTVSVFLNNSLLLHRKRLTDKAIVLNIQAFPNTDYELVMYAENLGRIPPNTSLMVITAGKRRYEMRISANEQKNAVVRIRYQR